MTATFNIPPLDGFGIVEERFLREPGLSISPESAREFGKHHLAALVQTAFVDPRLRQAGHLDTVRLEDVFDVVFDEVWPLLNAGLEQASYVLDSVEVEGQTLTFRDVTFLFSGLEWDQSPDFTVWRLPGIGDDVPWPEVTSAAPTEMAT